MSNQKRVLRDPALAVPTENRPGEGEDASGIALYAHTGERLQGVNG